MKRLHILISALIVLPVIFISWLLLSQSGLLWVYQQAESYLPADIHIRQLQGSLVGPLTLQGFEYSQQGVELKAEKIQLNWHPVSLLTAKINISQLHIQSLDISLTETAKTENTQDQPFELPTIHLPWRLLLSDAQINNLSLKQNNQHYTLQKLSLNLSTLFSQFDIKELLIQDETFFINISGGLYTAGNYHHNLNINWQLELPGPVKTSGINTTGSNTTDINVTDVNLSTVTTTNSNTSEATVKGNGTLVGNIKSTRLKQQIKGPLELTLNAQFSDLLKQLNWQLVLDANRFSLAQLNPQWPAVSGDLKLQAKGDLLTATLTGESTGEHPEIGAYKTNFNLQRLAENTLQINQLNFHTPMNNTDLSATGNWQPASNGGMMNLSLKWKNLRWPVQDTPWFYSANGDGTIKGTIDNYAIKINSDNPLPEFITSNWSASAQGNADGMTIDSLRISVLDGEASARGKLSWSPTLNWQADISAKNINPVSLLPDWPGTLHAKLSSTGRSENGQLIANANINQLNGKLRGYPVSLQSQLELRDKNLHISQLELQSASSLFNLQGDIGEKLNLNWSVFSENLLELYPRAAGKLQASGLVNGQKDKPFIDMKIKGQQLKLDNYAIATIEGAIAVDLFHWQKIDLQLAAQTININDTELTSVILNADSQQINATVISSLATTQAKFTGEVQSDGWRGMLETFSVNSKKLDNWQLKQKVQLNLTGKLLQIDPLCLLNAQQAEVCIAGRQKNSLWTAELTLDKIPLQILSPWMPPDLLLDGVANATADVQYVFPDQLYGQAKIELPPGVLSYPLLEGERDHWEYRGGNINLKLDKLFIKSTTDIAMTNGDSFQFKLSLPEAQLLSLNDQQKLSAEAHLNVHDLGIIEALIPEIQNLKGEVAVNLSATGTLGKPQITGQASLLNGNFRIPRLGLNIDRLKLQGQSTQDKLSYKLETHSGDGNLTLLGQTQLDPVTGWPTEITIKGNEFEVASIPDARVQVSPDLLVKIKQNNIDISGKVHIPYARLAPKDITTASRISSDVVIINSEQKIDEKWNIITSIRVSLGERVNFSGFGFDGRLGGSVLLHDEPGQLTRATGEITIPEGRYRAYGQRLDVEHGRLIYTGGPVTNPGLDFRAVRYINEVTAGLKVKGTLSKPQMELFSIPVMGQTDTLSYLLLGRPIENSSGEEGAMMANAALALGLSEGDYLARILGDRFGLDEMRVESNDTGDQASLVVGRYLSPKLYVSYGVGLIETFNTLTLRYQISDKWQLKAESGEAQGADILYTIER